MMVPHHHHHLLTILFLTTTVLIATTWGFNEETYPLSDNLENSYSYLEETIPIPEENNNNEFEMHRRSSNSNKNNFLRFGRAGGIVSNYEYDSDYPEDFARPTRSGKIDKNDYFIRFGRSKQDFLRFGRDPPRQRDNSHSSNYLRFGRSLHLRNKRETYSDQQDQQQQQQRQQEQNTNKRQSSSNFLRFGRDRPFLRFGRTNNNNNNNIELLQSPLIQLLNELLIENLKKEQSKINRTV